MGDILRLPLHRRGVRGYFIASDWHSFHLNEPSYYFLKKLALELPKKDRRLIIAGDFIDCHYFSTHNDLYKENRKYVSAIEDYFIPQYDEEMKWANNILDDLQKVFHEIILMAGNHDQRVQMFAESKYCAPAYRHYFNLPFSLNLKQRGIKFLEYNDWLDIGHLSITHGMYHGSSANKNHHSAANFRSVMYGHLHHLEIKSYTGRGDTTASIGIPCMANLGMEYLKNREGNWSNGFAQAFFKPDGLFNFYIYQIWNGELITPQGNLLSLDK